MIEAQHYPCTILLQLEALHHMTEFEIIIIISLEVEKRADGLRVIDKDILGVGRYLIVARIDVGIPAAAARLVHRLHQIGHRVGALLHLAQRVDVGIHGQQRRQQLGVLTLELR